jgi:hypothetical protein
MMTSLMAMSAMLAGFLTPMVFDQGRLWTLIPLALVISVVYKCTKLDEMKRVPMAALILWGTIIAGMVAVYIGMAVVCRIFI